MQSTALQVKRTFQILSPRSCADNQPWHCMNNYQVLLPCLPFGLNIVTLSYMEIRHNVITDYSTPIWECILHTYLYVNTHTLEFFRVTSLILQLVWLMAGQLCLCLMIWVAERCMQLLQGGDVLWCHYLVGSSQGVNMHGLVLRWNGESKLLIVQNLTQKVTWAQDRTCE